MPRTTTHIRLTAKPTQQALSVLLFLLVLLVGVATAGDWFDVADANHDGVVDRTEYDVALDKFLLDLEHRDSGSGSANSFWKSFFIAAVLSMKHDRLSVFTGAMGALILMTVLSTAMGLVLPKFLDRKYTHILSGILFLYFGIKLVNDSRKMEGGKHSEELEEVEEELFQASNKKKGDSVLPTTSAPNSSNNNNSISKNGGLAAHSVILTALTLTFVAEWGDRSQIATIALASSKNPIGVTLGGILGHSICTASACIGGRMLASNISEKSVSQWGGIVFLLFGLHSLFLEE